MVNSKNSLLSTWNNPYARFIITFIGLYLFLLFFNMFYIGITAPGGFYIKFLDDHLNYIDWWRTFSIESSATVIRWFGYKAYTNATQLAILGRSGFTLVYTCLGYGIMSAFIAFVLTFPKPFRARLGFLIGGIIFIQILNTIRFILLSLYWNHQKLLFNLDHHDLFNGCIYLILMAICYIWINFSKKHERNPA